MQGKRAAEAILNASTGGAEAPRALLSLVILSQGKEAPKEIRLFKRGQNDSQKGMFYFSQRSADEVMAKAADWGNRYHFDWNHAAALQAPMGGPAPAAAWCDLEMKDDGLYAVNIDWTPQGKKDVEEGSYKYISPYFDYDPDSREITTLTNAALTNLPALKQMEALASQTAQVPQPQPPKVNDMDRKALLASLGLPETATDTEMNAKVAHLSQFQKQMLSTTGAQSELEAMTSMLSLRAQADQVKLLQKQLEDQKVEGVKKEREALLSAAISEGKLEPGSDLRKHLDSQPLESVKVMLSALPAKKTQVEPPKGADANKGKEGGTVSVTLSQEQVAGSKKIAALFDFPGVSPEKLQEHHRKLIETQSEE